MYANLREMLNAGFQPGDKFVNAAILLTGLNGQVTSSGFGSALDNNNLIIYSFFKIEASIKLFTFGQEAQNNTCIIYFFTHVIISAVKYFQYLWLNGSCTAQISRIGLL